MCSIAKKEDITLTTFGISAVVLQIVITSDMCGFQLSDKFEASFNQIRTLYPRSYDLAVDYASYQKPSDCSKEKEILKDQLKR